MKILNLTDIGPPETPQDIKRFRRQQGDFLRRYGQPVVHLHRWNLEDVDNGLAIPCPACSDNLYGNQTRGNCPLCFGVGFASVELSMTHYLTTDGEVTTTPTETFAPRWGGFGEPVLTRVLEPDVPTDIFQINEQGVLVRTQQAQGSSYWTPRMGDNDLLVNVVVDDDNVTVTDVTNDRYVLKQVHPQTLRGWGKKTRNQSQFVVGQTFEMARVPYGNVFLQVPIEVQYGEI